MNAIAPGTTFTEDDPEPSSEAEQFAATASNRRCQRVCDPDELARLTVFLASDLSSVHHGPVDPGRCRRPPRDAPGRSKPGATTVPPRRGRRRDRHRRYDAGRDHRHPRPRGSVTTTARTPTQINASATHRVVGPGWPATPPPSLARQEAHLGCAAGRWPSKPSGCTATTTAYVLDEVASGIPDSVAAVGRRRCGSRRSRRGDRAAVRGCRSGRRSPLPQCHRGAPGSTAKADEGVLTPATRSGLPAVLTAFEQQLPPAGAVDCV